MMPEEIAVWTARIVARAAEWPEKRGNDWLMDDAEGVPQGWGRNTRVPPTGYAYALHYG